MNKILISFKVLETKIRGTAQHGQSPFCSINQLR
nr:MAG TPA: hypothetical protein [Caudoviricetes sp.]